MKLRHRWGADERGAAMVTVLGLTFVLTLVSVVALTFVRNAQPQARQHQDWHAALAAADAGIDDYLARINRDLFYHETDPSSQVAGTPGYNAALDPDAWAELVGSDGRYTYTVDTSDLAELKTIRVTSTGAVHGVLRTVEATLRPRTFLDYIYLTNVEPGAAFTTEDDVWGPLHTNDTLVMAGTPRFHGPVTVATEPPQPLWVNASWSSATPDFRAGDPQRVPTIPLPPSNAALSLQAEDTAGGCLYYGPTYIRILGDQMRVHSPRSSAGVAGTAAGCLGASSSDLLPLPSSGVIYVAQAPAFSGGHPLGLSGSVDRDGGGLTVPSRSGNWQDAGHRRAGDAFVWGELDGRLTIGAQRDIVLLWDLVYADPDTAMLGLIADDHINVWHPTNNTTNQPVTSTTGTVAPFPHGGDMPPPRNGTGLVLTDPRFDAAMLALNGSFRIFNLERGAALGDIFVNGAISQQRRHAVGVATNINWSQATFDIRNGYGKQYTYDDRLQYLSPPHFISPIESQYRLIVYAEVTNPDDLPA